MLRVVMLAGAVAGVGAQAAPLKAQAWEGVIEFKGFTHDSARMIQTSKGTMLRMDMVKVGKNQSNRGAVIFDSKTRMMTMIMYDQKRYMTTPMGAMDSMIAGVREGHKAPKISFKDTGRSEVVAGVKCEIYHGTTTREDGKVEEGEACLAKGVGFNMMENFTGKRGSSDPATELFREFAAKDLRMIKAWRMKDGKMEVALEATKIERKSIPDSEFLPPPGFTKLEIPKAPPHD
jgi:hypothetical protein